MSETKSPAQQEAAPAPQAVVPSGTIERSYRPHPLAALRRFAVSITVFTILGHAYLGFEQSYAQPLVSLLAAYGTQLLLETMGAWAEQRRVRFAGGLLPLVNFLLPAHITGLSNAMLLYFNDRLWVVAFTSALAISSKTLFRAPVGSGTRHIFNPSNFGISATLLLFPWVGLAMPWQFTAALGPVGDWALLGIIVVLGSLLHIRYARRFPVVLGFLGGFFVQALLRTAFFDADLLATLMPATGILAIIYTFYMVPDPATTPEHPWAQAFFGASVAAVYCILVLLHIVFGLFFALTIVSALRGLGLHVLGFPGKQRRSLLWTAGGMPRPE